MLYTIMAATLILRGGRAFELRLPLSTAGVALARRSWSRPCSGGSRAASFGIHVMHQGGDDNMLWVYDCGRRK